MLGIGLGCLTLGRLTPLWVVGMSAGHFCIGAISMSGAINVLWDYWHVQDAMNTSRES